MTDTHNNQPHPFELNPNKTLLTLAVPVLFSMIAEPLTGLVDTAFVARLGPEALASLGIGTMVFSSVFWVFGFLGIGTQTEVAQSLGKGDLDRASSLCWLAVAISVVLGLVLGFGVLPLLGQIAGWMGGSGEVSKLAVDYMSYRLLGAPAMLVVLSCFGSLRGYQDMRSPLWIAVGMNLINVVLDWVLVFGVGPFPEMGVAGAALASAVSQWIGAVWAVLIVRKHYGFNTGFSLADARRLFSIGGDMFVRTGCVCLFLLLCTRFATKAGADSGAAHQAIRQFFVFLALFLDAFAISGHSLVGYFVGRADRINGRKVAALVCKWSFATGIVLTVAMYLGQQPVAWMLVPPEAAMEFAPAWLAVTFLQPINALSFATDGIHLGTGDFRYLRNAMLIAVSSSTVVLFAVDYFQPQNMLLWIWIVAGLWTSLRALLGVIRIWPGIGDGPLSVSNEHA
ncbi:MATE family efflux transporter [Maridesulfovibrio hydrothermalis]|uniref:MATE efflux family protein n=1 Tax=Maridesulfovibrio hydrothermalis AM13 = DSM 14728 TaxID=1121451 RepID=L0RDC3_9BACT|nr:MATE family efflux transporter [Maridesulfovibrio hydrothermalis]CCO24200.1 MATE efflux family protein [Maridesulfovibrio hydrothermalis AM13 = DSM 14728]